MRAYSATGERLFVATFVATLLILGTVSLARQASTARLAQPVEPIAAILNAFRSHAIVALSDPHGNEQLAAFGLSLVRDSRIAAVVNDIVVENGNARHQDVMDRYIGGEDVSYEALRTVWETRRRPRRSGPVTASFPSSIAPSAR